MYFSGRICQEGAPLSGWRTVMNSIIHEHSCKIQDPLCNFQVEFARKALPLVVFIVAVVEKDVPVDTHVR